MGINYSNKLEPRFLVLPSELLLDTLTDLSISDVMFEKEVEESLVYLCGKMDTANGIEIEIMEKLAKLIDYPVSFFIKSQQNYIATATRLRDDFLLSKYVLSDETLSKLERFFNFPKDYFINLKEKTSNERVEAYLNYVKSIYLDPDIKNEFCARIDKKQSESSEAQSVAIGIQFIMPDFHKFAVQS